jgi:outer membrane biosynthesis protein TonB
MVLSPTLDDTFAPAKVEGTRGRPVGWAISLVLHALVAFFLIQRLSTFLPPVAPIVPVDVVELAEETVAPGPAPVTAPAAPAPRVASAQPRPAAAPVQAVPVTPAIPNPTAEATKESLPQDELETKLAALAKLRQPQTGAINGVGTSGGGGRGTGAGSVSVKDLIRAQVERRWSLDTETLNGRNVTVSIRVVLDRDGAVTSVHIVEDPRYATDALYHDIAVRARNAVLLSSPFALPQGHDEVTDVTLVLHPRDTFR